MHGDISWVVSYEDGTVLKQYEEDGTKHFYEDIDRTKAFAFSLERLGVPVFVANFDEGEGKKLIWRLRVQNQNGVSFHFHIVGKKGRYVALVSEDRPVFLMDNFNEDEALLSSPEPVKGEK